ncbi:MAG: hypothetical protein H6876_02670 [Hyphomicrobiaceae bacterium]|nr:hypothetical protein [Hyphomicrobiaceae bacterium]MCC0007009.1 hypothetical protein [Hyphomicrobiaceae bacterium]
MENSSNEFWFKPKTHGYGATPSTWQGWLATGVFSVLLGLVAVGGMMALKDKGSIALYAVWFVGVLGGVYWFTQFARRRTDGEWAWRWKGQKYADIYDPEKQQGCERK